MYGYLKPYSVNASTEVRRRYKQYYCSLCHALWKNYGQMSRLIVSYDITFIAVLLDQFFTLPDGKISCLKKSQTPQSEENWKKLAAMSIMMVASKIEDDILDEKSTKARIAKAILGKTIKKVKADFPKAYDTMLVYMKVFNQRESTKANVYILSDCFADVIIRTLQELFSNISLMNISILRHVSRWVYFIDAVDDLDQDLKEGKMNPFADIADSKHNLICQHDGYIGSFIDKCAKELLESTKTDFDSATLEHKVIANIIDGTIPEVTYKVFSDAPYYPRSSAVKTIMRKGVLYG